MPECPQRNRGVEGSATWTLGHATGIGRAEPKGSIGRCDPIDVGGPDDDHRGREEYRSDC
jgi:hypothetical protein